MSETTAWGVLFDMDGVLVDSYQAHYDSWQGLKAADGRTFSREQFALTFGRTSREIIAECWGVFTEERIRAIDEEKERLYREIVRASFPAMDGAGELIDALVAAGFKIAIGSSGPPENVAFVMEKLGRKAAFAGTVSGRDVARGKPDPEVFLKAAGKLGLPPRSCAVIEDAPPGVAAANAAGCFSVGFASTGHTVESLSAARVVVKSLRELTPAKIAAWLSDFQTKST